MIRTLPWGMALCLVTAVGCGEDLSGPTPSFTKEQLLDPKTCEQCHSEAFRQWSGSMHAYAAEDPVFRAMNAAGQRETGGALGNFCVNCHAPMAVREGYTTDGLNLDDVPQEMHGVTCYFCHSTEDVLGEHNNPLAIAEDLVMRGAIDDPIPNDAHASGYSPFLDRDDPASSSMCGACHDVVLGNGVHLERTFLEWKQSQFGNGSAAALNCGNCHMPGSPSVAAGVKGAPPREVHDHSMPGVDVALTPWPEMADQLAKVQAELNGTLLGQLCVPPPLAQTEIEVTLENTFAGHSFPSGAAHDRRAWVEVIAYEGDTVIYQSGVVDPASAIAELDDPDLWLFRDTVFNGAGLEVHKFWEVESFESLLLQQGESPTAPHAQARTYRIALSDGVPDRVTMRVRMRALGLEVLQELVDSGDLDPAIVAAMPTFDVLGPVEWRQEDGFGCVPKGVF